MWRFCQKYIFAGIFFSCWHLSETNNVITRQVNICQYSAWGTLFACFQRRPWYFSTNWNKIASTDINSLFNQEMCRNPNRSNWVLQNCLFAKIFPFSISAVDDKGNTIPAGKVADYRTKQWTAAFVFDDKVLEMLIINFRYIWRHNYHLGMYLWNAVYKSQSACVHLSGTPYKTNNGKASNCVIIKQEGPTKSKQNFLTYVISNWN